MKKFINHFIIISFLFLTTNTAFCLNNHLDSDLATESFLDFCCENGINLEIGKSTLLHQAAEEGRVDRVQKLLPYLNNIDILDASGCIPLSYAVFNNHDEVVDMLISAGSNPNSHFKNSPNNFNNLHTNNPNFLNFKENLVTKSDDNIKCKVSLLMYATENRNYKIIKSLVNAGATVSGITPLILATHTNDDALVKFLLSIGCDINEVLDGISPLYLGGISPLYQAIFRRNPEMVKFLLTEGADPNLRIGNISYLFQAIDSDSPQIVQLLLNAGADPDIEHSLLEAIDKGNLEIIRLLLANSANSDMKQLALNKAINKAIGIDNPKIVELILASSTDPDIKTSLFHAIDKGNPEIIRLLANSADSDTKKVSLLQSIKIDSPEIVVVILASGTDFCLKPFLKYAIDKGANQKIIYLLIASGAIKD